MLSHTNCLFAYSYRDLIHTGVVDLFYSCEVRRIRYALWRLQILLMWVYETALSHLHTAEGLRVSIMIPRDPGHRGLPNIWSNTNLFRAYSCMYMCFALTRCQELRISCWAPGADHPPLFSLVKELRGNHISRWIPSLFICTMLITASRKDQSYLNYPQSLQPPEDSPQR